MSHDEFFNTYFTGQKELSVMAAMAPAERAQFLSRVLGYERIRTAQGLVRERRKAIVSETAGLRSAMSDPETVNRALADATLRLSDARVRANTAGMRRVAARRALDEITPRWEAMQRERDALQALVSEMRVVDGERAALERDVARVDRELADAALARDEVNRLTAALAEFPALHAEMRELDRACNEAGRRRTLEETERALLEELAKLRDRRAKIDTAPSLELEATEQAVQRAVTECNTALEQLREQRDSANTLLTEAKVNLAGEDQLHASLGRQKPPLEERLRELAQLVQQRRTECNSFLQRKAQLETEIEEARRLIQRLAHERAYI